MGLMPLQCLIHQFSRVEQMLGPKMLGRPSAAFLKLNSQKITSVSESAIANSPYQFPIAVPHRNGRPRNHRTLYLKAYARKRDVLQIRHPPPLPS